MGKLVKKWLPVFLRWFIFATAGVVGTRLTAPCIISQDCSFTPTVAIGTLLIMAVVARAIFSLLNLPVGKGKEAYRALEKSVDELERTVRRDQLRPEARLLAYFDRSTVPRYGSVAVAGWMMVASRWDHYGANWREVLRSFGVSCLHMTDFEGGHKEFQGWPPERKRDFMRRLIGVLRRAGPLGVSVGLLQSDLDKFLSRDLQRKHVSAYGLCAVHAIGRVMNEVKINEVKIKSITQPIAFVFESGDERRGQIIGAIAGARKKSAEFDKRIASVRFEPKGSAWGLEAADLLAYETAKYIPRKVGLDPAAIRKSLWRLLQRTEHISIHLDPEALRRSLFIETTSPQ